MGVQVILSNAKHVYLDHPYERDNMEPGLAWARGSLNTRDIFDYHPPPTSNATGLLPQLLCRTNKTKKCPSLKLPQNIFGKFDATSSFLSRHSLPTRRQPIDVVFCSRPTVGYSMDVLSPFLLFSFLCFTPFQLSVPCGRLS